MVGRITMSRLAAPGAGNLHPLDEALGLPAGLYSPGLACWCAREAVRGSFGQAADAVERATGVRIGTRQVIGLVRGAAVDAAAYQQDRLCPAVPDGHVLVLTGDGKGVPVLPKALRPDAAGAAAKAGPGAGPRKRMAELILSSPGDQAADLGGCVEDAVLDAGHVCVGVWSAFGLPG